MPRRAKVVRRVIPPDAKYHSKSVAMFTNRLMVRGKKSLAERVIYRALDIIEEQTRRSPLDTFEQALRNVTPVVEVKPRRVGGATYQVPVDIRPDRRGALALPWLLASSGAGTGQSRGRSVGPAGV